MGDVDGGGGDEPVLVPGPGGGGQPARRRALVATVGVLVVAVAAAGAVLVARSGGDDGPDAASGGPSYLLPGWLPEGWRPESAWSASASRSPAGSGARSPTGEAVVYGNPGADDPWTGPRLAVIRVTGPVGEPDEGGDEVALGDRRGRISGNGGGWDVTVPAGDGHLAVLGRGGLEREQVLAAAEQATDEPAIPAGALPGRFAEIGRGGLDALAAGALTYVPGDGVAVAYGEPGSSDAGLGAVQRPGDARAVDLARFVGDSSRPTTVRGQHAVIVLFAPDDDVMLQWHEPPGTLVTVMAFGVGEDAARRFAEGLRPAGDDEVDRLVRAHQGDDDNGVGRGTGGDSRGAEECRELPDGTVECSATASTSVSDSARAPAPTRPSTAPDAGGRGAEECREPPDRIECSMSASGSESGSPRATTSDAGGTGAG